METTLRGGMDARRVLLAWIVAAQLLAFPFVAFGALMGLVAVPLRLEYWAPIVLILGVSLLVEAGVALFCAERLRERLRDRLSFSPRMVAFASSLGLLAAALLAAALAEALATADVPVEPMVLIPMAAAWLGFGSGLGTLVGCRYRPR